MTTRTAASPASTASSIFSAHAANGDCIAGLDATGPRSSGSTASEGQTTLPEEKRKAGRHAGPSMSGAVQQREACREPELGASVRGMPPTSAGPREHADAAVDFDERKLVNDADGTCLSEGREGGASDEALLTDGRNFTPRASVRGIAPASCPDNSCGSSEASNDRSLGNARRSTPPSLKDWLSEGPFVLSMAPGFFGFYAHIGALAALEDAGLLEKVSFATGASAGGLVAGLFAAGMCPGDMGRIVVKFRRTDFWDPIGIGGLLRGKKFENILEDTLPDEVRRFDQCRVPLAVSAFDMSRLKTRAVSDGSLAPALRATCTFPGLFAPVWHSQGVLVDGGVSDVNGMWCVPADREHCRRVLNVLFGDRDDKKTCLPPSRFPTGCEQRPNVEIATLPLTGLPRPHPFAMERGADALEAARRQVATVLDLPLLAGHEAFHWIAPTQAQNPGDSVDTTGRAGVDLKLGNKRARSEVEREAGSCAVGNAGNGPRGKDDNQASFRLGESQESCERSTAFPKAAQASKRRRTGPDECNIRTEAEEAYRAAEREHANEGNAADAQGGACATHVLADDSSSSSVKVQEESATKPRLRGE